MEVLKRDGTLRAEAAYILDAMERLNQAATAKQIADVYQKQHGSSIGKGYLDAVLADAKEKGLVFKNLGETYELTAKGRAYLKSYRLANAFGMELKPKTEENRFESKAAKTPENKNQTASVSRAEVRLAQKNNTEKASKREKTGAGQQNLEGGKMVKKSAGSNAGNVKKEKVVVGAEKRSTNDDIFCPHCHLFYPLGTIKCPKCEATIAPENEITKRYEDAVEKKPITSYERKHTTVSASDDKSKAGELISALAIFTTVGFGGSLCYDSTIGSGGSVLLESTRGGVGETGTSAILLENTEDTTSIHNEDTLPILAVGSIAASTSSDENPIIVVIEEAAGSLGDNMPYSVVEKRAETVYNVLHGQKSDAMRQPIIVAKTREQTEAVNRIFRTQRGDAVEEKLDLWISLLEKDEYVS